MKYQFELEDEKDVEAFETFVEKALADGLLNRSVVQKVREGTYSTDRCDDCNEHICGPCRGGWGW